MAGKTVATKRAKKSTETKSGRKKKDPNAPKRPLTAFMLFSKAERAKVKEDNPGIEFGAVGKELGKRWKEVDSKTKKKYEQQAEEAKKEYEVAIESYNEENGIEGKSKKPAAKKATKKVEEPAEVNEDDGEEDDDEDESD